MVALHRLANFFVVSSLHDGMNLVAKEFVASRTDEDGVLVLSRFTGAARELTDAVLVNPFCMEELAAAIAPALEMPKEERQRRMRKLRANVRKNNIYRWASELLSALLNSNDELRMSVATVSAEVCESVRKAAHATLYLDFDGTLSPLVDRPEDAQLPEEVRDILAALAMQPRFTVVIISGRSLADFRRRVMIPGLIYAGNHGLEISGIGLSLRVKEADAAQPAPARCARLAVGGARLHPGRSTGRQRTHRHRSLSPCGPVAPRERSQAIVRARRPRGPIPTWHLHDGKMVVEIRPRWSGTRARPSMDPPRARPQIARWKLHRRRY